MPPLGAGGMGEVFEVRRADGRFDGRAAVKLLDFGIAKAPDPLDAADRHANSAAEAARSELEQAPTLPGRLSPDDGLDPQWLQTRKRFEGHLDNLLMKLLAKLIGRHRVASAAVVLGTAGLAVGLGVSLWQRQRAVAARDPTQARLTQIRDITHDVVLRYGDAMTFLPGGLVVKEDLLKGLDRQPRPAGHRDGRRSRLAGRPDRRLSPAGRAAGQRHRRVAEKLLDASPNA